MKKLSFKKKAADITWDGLSSANNAIPETIEVLVSSKFLDTDAVEEIMKSLGINNYGFRVDQEPDSFSDTAYAFIFSFDSTLGDYLMGPELPELIDNLSNYQKIIGKVRTHPMLKVIVAVT